MKKNALFTVLAFVVFTTFSYAQTVWRVNNNPAADADFLSLAGAIANANVMDGHIIYVEPSSTSYGNVTNFNKSLTIIGNGYLLDQNTGLQENEESSNFGFIRLNAGSEGTRLVGLVIGTLEFSTNLATPTDITIEKCRFTQNAAITNNASTPFTLSNISIKKSYFSSSGTTSVFNDADTILNNLFIENCIFERSVNSNPSPSSTNLVFRNNVADATILTGYYVANSIFVLGFAPTFNSCVVRNNIFVSTSPNGVPANPVGLSFPDNGTNLFGATITDIYDFGTGTADGKFQLVTGGTNPNPAVGGGVEIGGLKPDCGPFGVPDPYVLSGIPDVPTIYTLSIQGGNSVPSGTNEIFIDFSTRSNN